MPPLAIWKVANSRWALFFACYQFVEKMKSQWRIRRYSNLLLCRDFLKFLAGWNHPTTDALRETAVHSRRRVKSWGLGSFLYEVCWPTFSTFGFDLVCLWTCTDSRCHCDVFYDVDFDCADGWLVLLPVLSVARRALGKRSTQIYQVSYDEWLVCSAVRISCFWVTAVQFSCLSCSGYRKNKTRVKLGWTLSLL